jgi:hypothetical protein
MKTDLSPWATMRAAGALDGTSLGASLGASDGMSDGASDGISDGALLGTSLGSEDGRSLGTSLGIDDGKSLGAELGTSLDIKLEIVISETMGVCFTLVNSITNCPLLLAGYAPLMTRAVWHPATAYTSKSVANGMPLTVTLKTRLPLLQKST